MRLISMISAIVVVFLFCMSAQTVIADDFGIVMDVNGKINVQRGEQKLPVEIGLNIIYGDTIKLDKTNNIVIVAYDDCMEWDLTGPHSIIIKSDGIALKTGEASPKRQLPVCYSLEEFEGEKEDVMGGFVLRGSPKDPLASLREEFKHGKASNSTLITLIVHDLRNWKIEQARPYYEELHRRMPDSVFVNNFTKKFNKRK